VTLFQYVALSPTSDATVINDVKGFNRRARYAPNWPVFWS